MARRYYSGEEYDGMIKEDRSATANLPQNVIIKPYPKEKVFGEENYGDSLSSIDKEISENKPKPR